MKSHFECPVCSGNEWQKCQIFNYETNNHFNPINLNNPRAKYIALRQHILSYLWFADKDEIKLTSLLCKKCGFMCYTPRPTESDLNTKYNFLNGVEKIGTTHHLVKKSSSITPNRAFRLYSIITKYKKGQILNVLDYGGGDGSLLKFFFEKNINCNVVDFNMQPVKGVKRLGSTINDISFDLKFDVIICNHVLEHVVDPVKLLIRLQPFLKEDGIIYIEVPMEIWKTIPIEYDPVTHINFFTKQSLKIAINESNYKIEKIKYSHQPYGAKYKRVTWSIITKNNHPKVVVYKPEKTFKLLKPKFFRKIARSLENIWLNRFLN